MKNHKFYHLRNEIMLSVYRQGQGRTGHRLFLQLFQNLMRRACLLLLLAATALGAGAQSKIAFSSTRDGNYEIYVMNADGTGQTNLTNNAGDDRTPSFSLDGSRIVFSSNRDGNGNYEIYVMNADGTGQTRLTKNTYSSSSDPVFSPDGKKIAFTSGMEPSTGIYIMNTDGTGLTNLVHRAGVFSEDGDPSFSQDGSRIVFTSNRDGSSEIYVMNADGTGQTRLTNIGGPNSSPSFSQDGSKIVFTSYRDGSSEIYVMNADGSRQTRLTYTGSNRDPSFSPDGSKIAFAVTQSSTREIYVMNANYTGRTNLTNSGGRNDSPSWGIVPVDSDGDGVPDVTDCAPADNTKWRTGTFYTDVDGDTYTVGSGTALCYGADTPTGYSATKSATDDCDDNNAALNPVTVWYKDADNDGYSDGNTLTQCKRPTDYKLATELTATSGDCDDTKAALTPATVWVMDADNDGWYTGDPVTQCASPGQGYAVKSTQQSGDCNDGDAAVHSPQTYYVDADKDGFGSTTTAQLCFSTATDGYSTNNTDCDDGDASIHPGATEIADDGIDQDCDGYDLKTWYHDADGDGYGNKADTLHRNTQPANYVSDSTDCNDSDAAIKPTTLWVLDADADGYYTGNPITQCTSPGAGYAIKGSRQPGDCNDGNTAVHPNAPEICGNGIDDNCNGQIDENCGPCANGINLTTTGITAITAQLNWKAPTTPEQWQVQYKSLTTGSKWKTVTVSGTARFVTLTGLQANQRYKWQLRAKCGKSWTSWSYEVEFTTLKTGSITTMAASSATKQLIKVQETLVVPNLLHRSQLWRIPNLPIQNKIVVADASGRTVLQAANYANNKAFTSAAAGLYFYQIITTETNGQSKTYYGKLLIVD